MSPHAPTALPDLLRAVLTVPTASYLEQGVLGVVRAFAAERGLAYAEDAYGNAYVRYRRGGARRPLVLGAHLDHPGFVVTGARGVALTLEFRGGLSARYGRGERLRLYRPGAVRAYGRAVIARVVADERGRIAGATARWDGAGSARERAGEVWPAVGDLALWDVPAFSLRGERVRARQCDDLAGATAVLATLDRLAASSARAHVIGLFTRAEEVGLRGASVVGREHLLPADALVVAVETSSMAGGRAEQGGGPIVRVGDAVHIFSPRMTRWMTALCQQLVAEDPAFRYQRKLMDGGVTEATAYDLYGYETGAACIALGNYHNAGPRDRVAAETVHLRDIEGLVRLFERMAVEVPRFERALPALRAQYDRLGKEAAPALRAAVRSRTVQEPRRA